MNVNEKIADFITKAAPALKLSCNYLSLDELLNLYKSKSFSVIEILSDADEATDSATYLLSLIRKNDLLPKANNVVVYMARGYEYDRIGNDGITHDALRTEERQLYDAICEIVGQAEGVGTGDLIVDVIPDLGQQTLLYVACYNGKPIAEEE